MDTQNPTEGHNGPQPGPGHQVMVAHRELSKLAATGTDAALLMLTAIRATSSSREVVRLPVSIEVGTDADLHMVRQLVSLAVGANLIVLPSSQGKAVECMKDTTGTLLLDLTAVSDKYRTAIMAEARARAVAGRRGFGQAGQATEMYGDTFILGPDSVGSERAAIVVRLDQSPEFLGDLMAFNKALAELGEWANQQDFTVQEGDLPFSRLIARSDRRAFLQLAARARALDALFSEGRFLEAVQATWALALEYASENLTEAEKMPLLWRILLDYHAASGERGDWRGQYRLDGLTSHVKGVDPELFGKTTDKQLTGWFRKYRVVKPGRFQRPRFPKEPGVSIGHVGEVQRTCVELAWDRIRALAAPEAEKVEVEE